jgi:biopolymer transport protein ExbB
MRSRLMCSWPGAGAGLMSWVLLACCAIGALSLGDAPAALAQDEEDVAVEEEVVEEPAPAPAGAPASQADPPPTSKLSWFYNALGPFYSIVFLGLSFCLVALVVMNLLGARRDNVVPLALVEGFEAHLNEKKFQEAYELAKADESFLGHVLAAGLAKLSSGYSQAIEAMQEVGEEENMKLEHRLSYISLIGAIAPMVGLLGTVDGMVDSFIVIAQATVAPKPSELAEGISTALVTTLVGLWLAIPAIVVYGILRNRMARLSLEVGVLSEGLMSRFQNVGGKKA